MRVVYIDCFYGFSREAFLGALADCGASTEAIEKAGAVEFERVSRMSIDCIRASIKSSAEDKWTEAIELLLKSLDADYVMCSPVPLSDTSDGEIISLLERAGIECVSTNEEITIKAEDARFLATNVSECGPKPDMDIISVGYGADGGKYFLCVTVGEYNSQELFLKKEAVEFV